MDISKLGAFCFLDAMNAEESTAFCRRVERMGYKVLWTPEAWGRASGEVEEQAGRIQMSRGFLYDRA
ncbi:MAG TPA: hypothetical protein VKK81_08230 [Candidatus Binatia bacterium]|nr:hypothetical protein [Candidatus Binatia bacterium]